MIKIYNSNIQDFTSYSNNVPIYKGSVLENPFSVGKRNSSVTKTFSSKDEMMNAFRLYFQQMYENNILFKEYVDIIYDKYKHGEDIYFQDFCEPNDSHGNIIINELQKKLIKESIKHK